MSRVVSNSVSKKQNHLAITMFSYIILRKILILFHQLHVRTITSLVCSCVQPNDYVKEVAEKMNLCHLRSHLGFTDVLNINRGITSIGTASLAGTSNAFVNSRQSPSWVNCTPLWQRKHTTNSYCYYSNISRCKYINGLFTGPSHSTA